MSELARLARRVSAQLYPDDPLRYPRVGVLACLAARGPMSQREVSESLCMDPGDLVGVIDALEELGFVVRWRDRRDRRRYALELTQAGRESLHERRTRAVRMNDTLFAPLDRAEREELEGLLLRVLAHHDGRFADPATARTERDAARPADDPVEVRPPRAGRSG